MTISGRRTEQLYVTAGFLPRRWLSTRRPFDGHATVIKVTVASRSHANLFTHWHCNVAARYKEGRRTIVAPSNCSRIVVVTMLYAAHNRCITSSNQMRSIAITFTITLPPQKVRQLSRRAEKNQQALLTTTIYESSSLRVGQATFNFPRTSRAHTSRRLRHPRRHQRIAPSCARGGKHQREMTWSAMHAARQARRLQTATPTTSA